MAHLPFYCFPLLEGVLLNDGNTDNGNMDLTMPNSVQDFSMIETPDPIAQQPDLVPALSMPSPSHLHLLIHLFLFLLFLLLLPIQLRHFSQKSQYPSP